MKKVLLISGSPRAGNTEYILKTIQNKLGEKSELVLLREKKIKHCIGCMNDKVTPFQCVFRDDMDEIMVKMEGCEMLVIGSPNYYENTPGLLRDFIDRTHPMYSSKKLENKKVVFVFVGGGEVSGTDKWMRLAVQGVVKYLKLKAINYYSFQGYEADDSRDKKDVEVQIDVIVEEIKTAVNS